MTHLERLRGGAWPFLVYGLLALLSFPMFGILVAGDHGLGYALDVFELPRTGVTQDWLANGPTFWNTHLTAGNALFAQQWYSPLAIDTALSFIVGPFGAYVATAFLLAASAGVSMHLFLRDSLRLPTVAVLAGGIMYTLAFWDAAYGFAAPLAPLLLWLIDRAVIAGPTRWRYVVGGGVLAALMLYHGLTQVVLLAALVQLAYTLSTSPDRRQVWVRVRLWAAQWIVALCLYGPVLVTQIVMLPISNRTIWDLQALSGTSTVQAAIDALLRYSQGVVGVPIGSGIGDSPGALGTFFVGAIGLPILVLGLFDRRRDRRGWFLLLLLLAIPLWDVATAVLAPVQQQLGILKSFQLDRMAHLFPFAVVANVAVGFGFLARRLWAGQPLQLRRGARIAIGLSLVPLAIALAVTAREVIRRRRDVVELQTAALGWALLGAALVVGLAVVLVVVVAYLRSRPSPALRGGAIVLVVLLGGLVGERALHAWGERLSDTSATIGSWADTLGITPAKTFLLQQPGIDVDRVLSFGGRPNQIAAAGMLQVDGYQSVYPLTYHGFFGALIAPQVAESPTLTIYYGKWGNRAVTFGPNVDPELVALSGARWLYVLGTDVPTVPGIVSRFHDGRTTVYEVSDVLPRAFIADSVQVRADQAGVLASLSSADLATLRGTVFVAEGADAGLSGGAVPGDTTGRPIGSATIASYTPDRVVVDVDTDRAGVLILTDVMAPGWVAERDGAPVPIATVDATFRGVSVGAGTRQVVFRYVPTFTYAGFGLAAIALVAAIVWAAAVRRRDTLAQEDR